MKFLPSRVLVQSMLNTIPNYFIQTTFLPISILNELDKIYNNFLWRESEGKNRLHLVLKETTFLPKSRGLGLRSHIVINKCLMAKHGWKLCRGPDNLAKLCIESKYIKSRGVTKFKNVSNLTKRGPGLSLA